MMGDLSEMIDEFDVGPLTVVRRADRVANQYGDSDAAAAKTFEMSPIAAHNVTGRDLDQVPEADRNSEIVQFYARAESWPNDVEKRWAVSDGGSVADVVTYRGRSFRIVKVRDFEVQGDVWCAFGALEEVQATP